MKTTTLAAIVAIATTPVFTHAISEDQKYRLSVGVYAAAGAAAGIILSDVVSDDSDPDKWTFGDTALELTFLGLTAIDMGQTLWFTQRGIREMNPLLGNHPSPGRVVASIGGTMVAHAVVAYLLPHPYRTIWQTIPIGFELYATAHNYRVGVKVSFKM